MFFFQSSENETVDGCPGPLCFSGRRLVRALGCDECRVFLVTCTVSHPLLPEGNLQRLETFVRVGRRHPYFRIFRKKSLNEWNVIRVAFDDLAAGLRPASNDPVFSELWKRSGDEDAVVEAVISRWRNQGR